MKFLIFPVMADEDILRKSHRGLEVGGGRMMPSNQRHENISGFTVNAENLSLQPRIVMVKGKLFLILPPSFPEQKCEKAELKRREKKDP